MATRSAAEKRLAIERMVRIQKQNKKLTMEVARLKGELVDPEQFWRDIEAANTSVKAHFLGLGTKIASRVRAAESDHEAEQIIRQEVLEILRDLASRAEASDNE